MDLPQVIEQILPRDGKRKDRGEMKTSRYTLKELISLWARERISQEQAIGQILLQLEHVSHRLEAVEKQVNQDRRRAGGGDK